MTALRLFGSFLIKLLIFSGILAGIHYLLISRTALEGPLSTLFGMHVFVVILTAVTYGILCRIAVKNFDKVGFAFLGLSLIKIMVSFVYLWPVLQMEGGERQSLVLHFFAIYFLVLFFEAREVYILLKEGPFTAQNKRE